MILTTCKMPSTVAAAPCLALSDFTIAMFLLVSSVISVILSAGTARTALSYTKGGHIILTKPRIGITFADPCVNICGVDFCSHIAARNVFLVLVCAFKDGALLPPESGVGWVDLNRSFVTI